MSRRKNNLDINVLLPETVITPNGSYTQFTGGEGFIPSLDYFKELEINKDRVNAVNKMLALEAPVDPHNPSMSYPSAALGVFGMSDDTRNYIFGNDNKRRTCLYTASTQYNDTPVASNRQFAANPEKYGFKEVDVKDAGVGDIVQFWENGKVPHHATVYTGNTPEGEPLISYSNGNTEAYREWKYPNGEYEVRGNIIKNRNISDGPVQDLGTQHYYRYIGSPQKHEQIERRYEMLKNGEHIYKDGGFFHPKDAWDELPLAEKAEMMEVAVRNGITNLQEIKKKYNEFADGGNFSSLPDNWTMEDESAYRQWLSNLPDNLKSTDDSVYDMRRAFKAGMVPVLNEDGYYHLGSRDPQTGRILKAPIHPTYLQAITEDARMGYYPTINDKGVTYTNTWKGNQFKGGGYTSSDSIRSRIAKYEGKAMTGAIDPLSGKWDKNRSFEAEDASFYAALPESIRGKVLANPDLADNLYSYSYNVGAGNFKKRVVPALEKYYQGKATVGDIERSMWASGDAKLRGLRTRRAEERAGVRAALDPTKPIIERPVSTTVFNPYALQQQNTVQLPQYIPSETEYIRTIEVSPEQQRAIQLQERFDQINRFNQLMKLAGIENTAMPAFMPETGVTMLDDIWNTGEYAKGGRIHIKPENRGKFTALKKRTGKSASWFKAHGTPAQKKMATFALNARKWKHGLGGNLYSGTTQPTQKMNIGLSTTNGWQPYTLGDIVANGERVAQQRKALQDTFLNFPVESNDATTVANGRPQNTHLEEKAIRGGAANAAWEKDNPAMATVGLGLGAIPLGVATLPAVVPAGEALASTAAGQLATKFLTHPITKATEVAMAGGHGLNDLFSGNANALTALELTPLTFPYGNFIKGTGEAINFVGNKIPTPIKEAWANRAEKAAMFFGDEGKTWARVTDPKGKEGVVFLNTNNNWKTAADWLLHPQQTYRDFRGGYYPMTRKQWKNYLTEEQKALDYAKQKSIELNDAQLKQRLSLQQENFLDNRARNNSASIKINTNPNSPFSLPRAPRNASEVANNVKVVSRDKDVSYGGKWFDPKFGTGTAAVSHPDKNVIVLPRHYQTQFSNRLTTMPGRGYTSPIETRMHMYVHELQHQMQQNLPLLNLSQPNATTMYYEPWDHFLSNIDSENLLLPFKETAQKYPGSWLASPNEYNAESNAYRVVDDYRGRRSILDPLDEVNASRLSGFGLNFDQIESLWNMGYKDGGHLRR